MKITKFTHACVRLERDGVVLVIDPGNYTEPEAVAGADAVIITHKHPDHLEPASILAAYERNRDLLVLAPADAAELLSELGEAVTVVGLGERHAVAGFEVATFGGEHATIVDGFPVPQNVCYLVDDALYYPGDSFVTPDVEVETLLVPASAPWMKIAEAIDFVRAVAPHRAHPTHDALLSDAGKATVDAWFERATNTDFSRLPLREPIDR